MSIKTGVYRIRNLHTGTYIDANHDDDAIRGWEVQTRKPNQKWLIENTDDGYILRGIEFDKYAYVADNVTGTKLRTSDKITYWDILPKNGGYAIRVRGTNQSVDLDSGKLANGTSILLNPANENIWQVWYLEGTTGDRNDGHSQFAWNVPKYTCAVKPGTYVIRNVPANTVVDLTSAEEGATVTGYAWHNGQNQKWRLEAFENGYRIKNVWSGTYLGWDSSQGLKDGARLFNTLNPDAARYTIRSDGDEYRVFLYDNNYVFDLFNGGTANGTLIKLWTYAQGPQAGGHQRWRFEPVD